MVKNGNLIDVEPDGTITVAGKPIGGGSSDRELTLTSTADSSTTDSLKIYVDDDKWNKVKNCYYDTIKIYYSDGNPLGVFHVLNYNASGYNSALYGCVIESRTSDSRQVWFGSIEDYRQFGKLDCKSDSNGNYISFKYFNQKVPKLDLSKTKFDALYKLADKPTQDGTYVLKATVSGGAVSYTWVAQ